MPSLEAMYLCVNQCPKHREYFSVSIDLIDSDGSGFGKRVTPSKCCGQWRTLHKWKLSREEWQSLATESQNAAAELTRQLDEAKAPKDATHDRS